MEECQSYGPEAVAKTLIAGGIGVCFAKPQPSESDLMAAFCGSTD